MWKVIKLTKPASNSEKPTMMPGPQVKSEQDCCRTAAEMLPPRPRGVDFGLGVDLMTNDRDFQCAKKLIHEFSETGLVCSISTSSSLCAAEDFANVSSHRSKLANPEV